MQLKGNMRETELKVLEVNPRAIERKIKKLGGKKIGSGRVSALHYDFPDCRLTKKHEVMRLRRNGEKIEITFKRKTGKSKRFKVSHEVETTVEDFGKMHSILLALGLRPVKKMEKKRTSFELYGVKIEIDEHAGIPAYMEIEGSQGGIRRALGKLGYSLSDTTNLTAAEVLKKYGVNPAIKPTQRVSA